MKRRFVTWLSILTLLAVLVLPQSSAPAIAQTTFTHDVIIYGAGFGGIAAALNAYDTILALNNRTPRILLINPQSVLGGLGTINGQNFWDWRLWQSDSNSSPQWGNHLKFIRGNGTSSAPQFDQFYSTDELANWFAAQINAKSSGITLLQPFDVRSVVRNTSTGRITSVTVQQLTRQNQAWLFDSTRPQTTYTAPVFIDASENGRLTRLSGITTTTGRQDRSADRRQMVATLMFRAKGVNYTQIRGLPGWGHKVDYNGTVGFYGGGQEIAAAVNAAPGTTLHPLGQFNKNNTRYQIKAMNVAEDRASTAPAPASELDRVYWFNTLLIVGVDGTCERKDGCPDTFTYSDGSTAWSSDYAFAQARAVLSTPEFINAMRAFPGFANFQLVTITVGGITYPQVGESIYLRETLHTPLNPALSGTSNYALTQDEIINAGDRFTNGSDQANYANRIGLGFYQMDSNGYTKTNPASGNMDPDPNPYNREPANPSYVPVDAILTSQSPNLIVAGYTANIGSWGWTMMRVLPNLTVLGDAAGVLAGYAVNYQADPLSFASNATWMTNVRNRIKLLGGRVDKCQTITATCTR